MMDGMGEESSLIITIMRRMRMVSMTMLRVMMIAMVIISG